MRTIRGTRIAMVFQDPMTALNPVYTIGFQIREAIQAHSTASAAEADARALELLRLVEMPDPKRCAASYPHQLSGGQLQRAMIAQAIACDPEILLADEPTTALDVTVQAEILALLRDLQDRLGSAVILVTHDMGVVADMADRVLVMRNGTKVEEGTAEQIFNAPTSDYTRELLAAVPRLGSAAARLPVESRVAAEPVLIEASALRLEYRMSRRETFTAIESLDMRIRRGELVGMVGESGSGKSTVGRAIVGLLPVASGGLQVAGVDMTGSAAERRRVRSRVGMVFQSPSASLNPRIPISESIAEPLRRHRGLRGAALEAEILRLLDRVHLPAVLRNRYPHEISGGQRQRVSIARAIGLNPEVLVADEPTSALDVSVQAAVLETFRELQDELRFACLFITHDLAVVEELADRVIVLRHGVLMEEGRTAELFASPTQQYTRDLLAAVPFPDPAVQRSRRQGAA